MPGECPSLLCQAAMVCRLRRLGSAGGRVPAQRGDGVVLLNGAAVYNNAADPDNDLDAVIASNDQDLWMTGRTHLPG